MLLCDCGLRWLIAHFPQNAKQLGLSGIRGGGLTMIGGGGFGTVAAPIKNATNGIAIITHTNTGNKYR
jgi:hypothetical protein